MSERMNPRAHLSEGVNRARLILETRRSLRSLPALLFAVVATLAGAALLFGQLTPTLFKSTKEVRFAIDDAYGILEGVDDVRYRGVPAGTIQEIERNGTRLVLKTKLRKELPVYGNAQVELRTETPLNDTYLDIVDPGDKRVGELGDVPLPQTQVKTWTKINDVLNTLGTTERTRLSQLLDNLGNGLRDRGDSLRAAITESIPFVRAAGPIARALAEREGITKRLLHNASILTRTLGTRERQLRTLVREGAGALGTLQEGSEDLDATLRELPPVFTEVNASFGALRGVLDDVDGAVARMRPVADRLPSSLSALRGLNADLAPAVTRLQRPVRSLVPLATHLRPVTTDLDAIVRAFAPQVPTFNKVTDGLARCEKGVIGFFQWNASLSKFGDMRGPIPRGNLAFNHPDLGLSGQPTREPGPNCAGGKTISGRPALRSDEG